MVQLFNLEIVTPERNFFEGEVESLVINTKHGEMGVLYNTLPMVTTLDSGVIRIMQKSKWMEAISSDGFVRISKNMVTILAQNCDWPHEIDLIKENQEIDLLAERMKKIESMREYKMAKAQLARQIARLRVTKRD